MSGVNIFYNFIPILSDVHLQRQLDYYSILDPLALPPHGMQLRVLVREVSKMTALLQQKPIFGHRRTSTLPSAPSLLPAVLGPYLGY